MRVESLTFLRFVAALIVVFFHFGRDYPGFSGFLSSGPEMVTFFFVLSGFVMGLAYLHRQVSAGEYLWARGARILPVYFLALFLTVAHMILAGDDVNATSLLLNMTLLQSWFSPHPLSLNTPGWSLSVEAFFYLSFPVILLLIRRYRLGSRKLFMAGLLLWAVIQGTITYVLTQGGFEESKALVHDLVAYFPLTHLCSFLLGISGAMWFLERGQSEGAGWIKMALLLLVAMVIVLILNNKDAITEWSGLRFAFGSSLLSPLFLGFVVLVAINRNRILLLLSLPPLVVLGEASYSLYIMQKPAYLIYDKFMPVSSAEQPLMHFWGFVAFLITVSILLFFWFEKPMNRFLRSRFPGRLSGRSGRRMDGAKLVPASEKTR